MDTGTDILVLSLTSVGRCLVKNYFRHFHNNQYGRNLIIFILFYFIILLPPPPYLQMCSVHGYKGGFLFYLPDMPTSGCPFICCYSFYLFIFQILCSVPFCFLQTPLHIHFPFSLKEYSSHSALPSYLFPFLRHQAFTRRSNQKLIFNKAIIHKVAILM